MEHKVSPPQDHQVFISFRGAQLRNNFISYLVDALRRNKVNVFIDKQENKGEDISHLLKRIEESRIAIVVFSSRYTESVWCLREAVTVMEQVEQGMLKVLPIFYKVSTENVKQLKGEFGDHFRDREWEYRNEQSAIEKWKKALRFISGKLGMTLDEQSPESDFIALIVEEVLKMLEHISSTTEPAQHSRTINQVTEKGETSSNCFVVKTFEKRLMAKKKQTGSVAIRSKVRLNQSHKKAQKAPEESPKLPDGKKTRAYLIGIRLPGYSYSSSEDEEEQKSTRV